MPLLGDPARVEAAVEHYLERFESHGWLEHQVYAGIGEAIGALHADGYRLAVVTAKNEPHARRILAHLPIGHPDVRPQQSRAQSQHQQQEGQQAADPAPLLRRNGAYFLRGNGQGNEDERNDSRQFSGTQLAARRQLRG